MRLGSFVAPFHEPGASTSASTERDLELARRLEELGYDEIWYGEHHSGGWETIASPEIMIAAAAQRTRRIHLGTGVISLPYHHPFTTAQRVAQLDHVTRGRLLLGVGPGVLERDARMLGLSPRDRAEAFSAALEAMLALFEGEAPVSRETEFFRLVDAELNLRPATRPHPPLFVTSSFSMRGVELAARLNAGLLQLAVGGDFIPRFHEAEARLAREGLALDRSRVRLVLPVHVAGGSAAAVAAIREAAAREHRHYWIETLGVPDPGYDPLEHAARMAARGALIVGSPEECIEGLNTLLDDFGPLGGLLVADREWAGAEATMESYRLLKDEVLPNLRHGAVGLAHPPHASRPAAAENR